MKRSSLSLLAFLAATSLAGAAWAQEQKQEAPGLSGPGFALFRAACLQNLPGFDGAEAVFADAGLERHGELWSDAKRRFFARVVQHEDAPRRSCFVAITGQDMRPLADAFGSALAAAAEGGKMERIDGPREEAPPLFIVDYPGSHRMAAMAANSAKGYGIFNVEVEAAPGTVPPWVSDGESD